MRSQSDSTYLLPHWQRLLEHVPGPSTTGRTAVEVYTMATWWASSRGQVAHALRRMRDDGLLESPARGRFRLTSEGQRRLIGG